MSDLRVRVVDYVANPGGGVRFAVETIRALLERGGLELTVVSHGEGLRRYRDLLAGESRVGFLELPPANLSQTRVLMQGIPGAGPLNWLLGRPRFHYQVPAQALAECEVAWLPWCHRHRLREGHERVVASLHDVILLEYPGIVTPRQQADERETMRHWLASSAEVVVSARTTAATLQRLFGTDPARVRVLPLSGQHQRPPARAERRRWPFDGTPYLLCPSNVAVHKNHEVLLAGCGASGARHPLVLTGGGTDLWAGGWERKEELRRRAEAAGLERDRSLFGLGYVDDVSYYEILDRAWALVMPTLAEGGGSFPVLEAMLAGVPVVASDIPVMREMLERAGGTVLWFDPRSPEDLSRRLAELERDYESYKRAAEGQARELRLRSWAEVAADYARLLEERAARS